MDLRLNMTDVLKARRVVYRHLTPTPLLSYPLLDDHLGSRVFVKHENHNPTGSFKIRGGLNLVHNLSPQDKKRGVITATRGNHGQSIALASQLNEVACTILVPRGNNPEKNEAVEAYGAELIEYGRDFDEAREKAGELQLEKGLRFVHSAHEPDLIHGVATYALEILESLPDPDVIFVPLGAGSGLSAVITVMKAMSPQTKIIGVQAAEAPSYFLSWKEDRIVTTQSAETIADGLATRVPFEGTFEVIRQEVDEILTVSEDEICQAIRVYLRTTHNLAEGAAAAALAGAFKIRKRLKDQKTVLIMSGGNIDSNLLRRILDNGSSPSLG